MRALDAGVFSSPEKRNVVLGLLLVVITLAIYNPLARHPFVNYDDDRYVTDNAHVRAGLHWETVKWAFRSYEEANWHPLTWISHAVDCQVFGLNPAGHHYVNLLLHACNVVLLFLVLLWATGAAGRSWLVAALFAIHPVNVETVAWVAERKNILSMFFFLLALAAYQQYVRKPSRARYSGIAAAFACGLMAKPMVITLPFVLLLWDYWPLRRSKQLLSLLAEKIPLFILCAADAVITVRAQRLGNAMRSVVQYPILVRLENAAVSYVRYLGKAVWPAKLSPMYPYPSHSLAAWQAIGAAMILVIVSGVVIASRRHRSVFVGWFWFLGTLVPMIGLVQVGNQAMADRYAYLPFIGLFVMAGWGVTEGTAPMQQANAIAGQGSLLTATIAKDAQSTQANFERQREFAKMRLVAAGTICVFLLSTLTYRQLGFWKDNVTLWSHAVEVTPANFIAEDNLGGALLEVGRADEAIPHFRRAAEIEPLDPMSRLNLAADAERNGDYRSAIGQFTAVLQATNDVRLRAIAFIDLGYCYRRLGSGQLSAQSFQAAIRLRPESFRAWTGLGLLAQDSGAYEKAAQFYSTSVSIQPWDLSYYLLAQNLVKLGHRKEAETALQQARRVSANFERLPQIADEIVAK